LPMRYLFPPFPSLTQSAATETYTLSLHDALPILEGMKSTPVTLSPVRSVFMANSIGQLLVSTLDDELKSFVPGVKGWKDLSSSSDRKSTRLNSSHVAISYAVFCLKKKKVNRSDGA